LRHGLHAAAWRWKQEKGWRIGRSSRSSSGARSCWPVALRLW
jgi:hypothetical protein